MTDEPLWPLALTSKARTAAFQRWGLCRQSLALAGPLGALGHQPLVRW